MNIGTAADISHLPAKTIRYYEEIGLVTPGRRENGYRDYSESDLNKLRFVQRARGLGFTVEQCRQLLSLYDDDHRASADVKKLAMAHLDEVNRKLKELRQLKGTLQRLVDACHGDERPDCPILEELAGEHDI